MIIPPPLRIAASLKHEKNRSQATVRLLVPGHFYIYAVSKFSLRENDISVLLL